ncbi:DNA repair protein RecN [Arenibaculum pallidiluteum]|uniref:DNA repair protein RecN n=1 Tax=Arenibaculum pallidiluteum TaxID=2812559 RepID=UPI001A971BB9|nr:DNA repair protein RecN [Arenibaculum pallidiluteum]
MLAALSIRDVVLIERLSLAWARGLCVLTGETGAGKSILLDALGLALGGRGDSTLVRHGAEQASVTAEFDLPPDHPAMEIVREQGLEAEDTLVLRRVLSADGRSRAYVNDQAVGVALLRRIGESLVEVHGQFETHGLLDPRTHRGVLDDFGGLSAEAGRAREAWAAWRQVEEARANADAEIRRARAEEDYLRHAVAELDALDPREGEEEELAERRAVLMHGERLMEALNGASAELSGDRGAERAIAGALRTLSRIADRAAGRLDPVIAGLDRAAAELAEAVAALNAVSSSIDMDPRTLEKMEERLFALRAAARKHGTSTDALPALRRELAGRLALIEDQGDRLQVLAQQSAQAREAYLAAAQALSAGRVRAAGRLDKAVAAELPPLKLDKARFATVVEPAEGEAGWGPDGIDRVAFVVATNPGAPPGPLAKIASGGELARFMLALKVVLAQVGTVPTLVFDEVDTGIGGAVADAVGERLARLGQTHQVLVVTHSPQVAARGAHHWRVQKATKGGRTMTDVVALPEPERREEIARMLSGATVTEEARAAAAKLIAARV